MNEFQLFGLEPSKPHQCTYHSEGRRCRAIALQNQCFCVRHRNLAAPPVVHNEPFELTDLNSREAIHRALTDVAARLATNRMDLKRAGILAYTLRIASANLSAIPSHPSNQPPAKLPAPPPNHSLG